MFRFYAPWFALLFPLPFIFKKLFPLKKIATAQTTEIYFPCIERLQQAFGTPGAFQKKPPLLFNLIFYLVWFFLVLALMQPEKIDQYLHQKNKGYDIMLAVDISASMQAVDFSTSSKVLSRLDVTKEVVGKFVKERIGDRIGLITFGESAYQHVPLTLDTVSVSKMLNDTVPGMAGNATAIGDAIGLGVKALRERPEGSRILVLLTDGEDNSSSIPPLEAAKLAKQYGIRIYTIGIGKSGAVPFPTQFGKYALAEVKMDEDLLKEIAEKTDGAFFNASDKKSLEKVYEKINLLEKTEANQTVFLIREPLYAYPLALAMLLMFFFSLYELIQRRMIHGF